MPPKVKPGTLKIDPVLNAKVVGKNEDKTPKYEDTKDQVDRIVKHLKDQLKNNPDKKIALIYAANDQQAEKFHTAYSDPTSKQLPSVSGSGQAKLFEALIKTINSDDSLKGKIRVLPVATSIKGGENNVGNIASKESNLRDLKAIQKHILDGYDVLGIGSKKQYSIGGGASTHWKTQAHCSIQYKGALYSQGNFVQMQLDALKKNPQLDLDQIFADATLLIDNKPNQAQVKKQEVAPSPVVVSNQQHNLTGAMKKDWEDVITNYNKTYDKKVPTTSNALEFKSADTAINFMKEQAAGNKQFSVRLSNHDGTKKDYFMFSRGDGKCYEGSAKKIADELRDNLNSVLKSDSSDIAKIAAIKETLKFEGLVSNTSPTYKELENILKTIEANSQEQKKEVNVTELKDNPDVKDPVPEAPTTDPKVPTPEEKKEPEKSFNFTTLFNSDTNTKLVDLAKLTENKESPPTTDTDFSQDKTDTAQLKK